MLTLFKISVYRNGIIIEVWAHNKKKECYIPYYSCNVSKGVDKIRRENNIFYLMGAVSIYRSWFFVLEYKSDMRNV